MAHFQVRHLFEPRDGVERSRKTARRALAARLPRPDFAVRSREMYACDDILCAIRVLFQFHQKLTLKLVVSPLT